MSDEPRAGEGLFTDGRVRIAAHVVGAVLILVGVSWRFGGGLEGRLPAAPPRPELKAVDLAAIDRQPAAYRVFIEEDARAFGLQKAPTIDEMGQPFAYEAVTERKIIGPGGTVETEALRIELAENEHIVTLKAINKTDQHLAYRIATVPEHGRDCNWRVEGPRGNLIALPPRGSAERTECNVSRGFRLRIDTIETMRIPPISFHYLGKISPLTLGLGSRLARSHLPAQQLCAVLPDRAIEAAMRVGDATWRDVADFYARHNCEKYVFPVGYRAIEKAAQYTLPVTDQTLRKASP